MNYKKNIFQILLTTGCLSLICLLGACNGEDDIVNNQVIINGNTAILTFTVGESDFNSEQINTRSTVPNDTVRQELGDGYVIETVIAPDTVSALTRGATPATHTVKDDVKILVIAYRGENLYKREVATVKSGKFAIHLPPGETFKLLFYSYNEPNQSAPTEYCSTNGWTQSINPSESGEDSYFATGGATINVVENETARDMMWTTANVTVTSTTKLEKINFKHLFCKVILNVTCDDDMTALTAVIGPKAFSYAKVDISADPNGNSNKRWVGMGTRQDAKIVSNTTGGAKQLGGQTDLIPKESEKMTLGYEKITIYGKDYKTAAPTALTANLTRGHRYTITSKVKKQNLVTVTYHENAGEKKTMVTDLKPGDMIVLPEDIFVPQLEHVLYTWNTKADGTGTDYENGYSLKVTSNIDLYAIWRNPCVPGYDGKTYLWDAKTAFTGSLNDDTAPQMHDDATQSASGCPTRESMDMVAGMNSIDTDTLSLPEYRTLDNQLARGGVWIRNPKTIRDTASKTRANRTTRPTIKQLCDEYCFFPNRGSWKVITDPLLGKTEISYDKYNTYYSPRRAQHADADVARYWTVKSFEISTSVGRGSLSTYAVGIGWAPMPNAPYQQLRSHSCLKWYWP